jgi:ribulose-phosphate 3-epimerase
MHISLAPSILSADFSRLEQEVRAVEAAGADVIHVDVMDGHFVPNLTIGPIIVKAARKATHLPLDIHLMIEHPDFFVNAFADAGGDIITVHAETGYHLFRTIGLIKSCGKKAGVALNPSTPLGAVEEVLTEIDLLLVMTVNPGFGGQDYIPSMTGKIERARRMLDAAARPIELAVDGGIKAGNCRMVTQAGATMLVMGTEIFQSGDYRGKLEDIRRRVGA